MKLPAIQFYPADWRKDPGVQSLDYFDRGVWFEILCLMHESPERGKLMLNGEAMPDEALARVLGLDNQTLTKTLTTLLRYGVASRDQETGALINRRMVKDENLRQVRTEAGKKGGNPALLNQRTTTRDKQIPTTPVKQIPTPSSSSSVASSSSDDKRERPAKSRDDRIDHPAIKAVREVKGKYPDKDVWDLVIKALGLEPDISRLRECWLAWRAKDFRPNNVGWIVDWYSNGIPGQRRNGNGQVGENLKPSGPIKPKTSADYIAGFEKGLKLSPSYAIDREIEAIVDPAIRAEVSNWWSLRNAIQPEDSGVHGSEGVPERPTGRVSESRMPVAYAR